MPTSSSSSSSSSSSLKLIKTLWGIDEPISKSLFVSIKEEGYHGVEIIRLAWLDPDRLVEALNHAGLSVVCQIHTSGGFLRNGEYIYCDHYNVEEHMLSFSQNISECRKLISRVDAGGFVNVHAGVDAWSMEEALCFLQFCLKEQQIQDLPFPVMFETHRQRLFGSPFQTRELLSQQQQQGDGSNLLLLKDLKLNADLSHWYCACERVFDPKQGRDAPWWPELINQLSHHCHYIHARFGWAQGPQMADPSASECEPDRMLQMDVWKQLLSNMKARGSSECCYVSPEYGPAPYLPVMPHSQNPVASLPDAVSYTKQQIEMLFEQIE